MKDSYITVCEFMIRDLKLKGNRLLAFAVIHSYSQDSGEYYAGMQYLAYWMGTSKQTAITVVKSLVEDGLISRTEGVRRGKKRGIYKSLFDNSGVKKLDPKDDDSESNEVNTGVKNLDPYGSKNLTFGVKKFDDKGQKILPNKIYKKDKSETELLPGFDLDDIDRRNQEVDHDADMEGFTFYE